MPTGQVRKYVLVSYLFEAFGLKRDQRVVSRGN